jgi:hypothetical protein
MTAIPTLDELKDLARFRLLEELRCPCNAMLSTVHAGAEGRRFVRVKSRVLPLDFGDDWQLMVECRRCRRGLLMTRLGVGNVGLIETDPPTRGVVAD